MTLGESFMLTALPALTEQVFINYIQSNYTGTYIANYTDPTINGGQSFTGVYPVYPYFGTGLITYPLISVQAKAFREVEPGMQVFDGKLGIAVATQVDDVANALETHDSVVSNLYELLQKQALLDSVINQPTGSFHLWGIYSTAYDQDIKDRCLLSLMEFNISAQTLAVPS